VFAASLSLHVSVLLGAREPFRQCGGLLFCASVILMLAAAAFIKEGLDWMNQIKSCPKWMWRTAVALWLYSFGTLALQAVLPQPGPLAEQPIVVSGCPTGLDAMFLCVIYSVLWGSYLDRPELIKRVGVSIAFVGVIILGFLAHRAGYLPPRPETHWSTGDQ
jgi:hypothetical protein